jgi:superoxide dismutase, Fe-Mn family
MDKRYTLPNLPYDYAALEPHYSARLLELHHDKHHAAYVAGANTTLEKLAEAREKNDFAAINQLQKNLAFHLSGHVLHSLFWRNMSPHGGGEPDGELADAVKESFGSVANLKAQLNEAALNVQGSGWGTQLGGCSPALAEGFDARFGPLEKVEACRWGRTRYR